MENAESRRADAEGPALAEIPQFIDFVRDLDFAAAAHRCHDMLLSQRHAACPSDRRAPPSAPTVPWLEQLEEYSDKRVPVQVAVLWLLKWSAGWTAQIRTVRFQFGIKEMARVGDVASVVLLFAACKRLPECSRLQVALDDALFCAASRGQTGCILVLVELCRADVDGSVAGRPLCVAVDEEKVDAVKLLLSLGADVHKRAKQPGGPMPAMAPIGWAAYRGNSTITRILLEAGADPSAEDDGGKEPLFWAVMGSIPMIAALEAQAEAQRSGNDWLHTNENFAIHPEFCQSVEDQCARSGTHRFRQVVKRLLAARGSYRFQFRGSRELGTNVQRAGIQGSDVSCQVPVLIKALFEGGPPAPCDGCGSVTARKLCSGCNNAIYCSAACQKRAWKTHKTACKAFKSAADREVASVSEAVQLAQNYLEQQEEMACLAKAFADLERM